ncbi:MAG: zinc-binding dehydrogenase [Lentisphaeria bacterium]|nr:zinc-binding dehydrogenase [Lentisphaeria bacterium]MBO7152398.1 zinc-binding dehydrogenase [Lentisphaeria bacterium]
MKTTAVRLYGKRDLRLETFELPELSDDTILAQIVSDSVCMSTYKTVEQGAEHKRVPDNVAENPVIIGHELCGVILKAGKKWADKYHAGDKFAVQPVVDQTVNYDTIGYTFPTVGGDSEYVIIPNGIIEKGCIMPYTGDASFKGSLAEPMSCIIGGFRAFYHSGKEEYTHEMGIVDGGQMAIIGGTGPMGLGAIDYVLNGCQRKPRTLVVTDINASRLARAEKIFSPEKAAANGITLKFVDTSKGDADKMLMDLSSGKGYDDILCMAPVQAAVELADRCLAHDGCLNFFAGPMDKEFSAVFNFYNVHYASTHVTGTSGGTVKDLQIALDLMSKNMIHPEVMITHVGGLDAAIDTTMNLPSIPGGKKIIYPGIRLPLTAIEDFSSQKDNPLFSKLAACCEKHDGLWNLEAEQILLSSL